MYMCLAPGETFEHTHAEPSITMLVEGNVELAMEGVTSQLVRNERVYVPAATSHVLVNRGGGPAIVECGH